MMKSQPYRKHCPTCGANRVTYPDGTSKMETQWSRANNAEPMDLASFHTKCCRFVRDRGDFCINIPPTGQEYDARYDYEEQHQLLTQEIQNALD
jgi:hypothetical protein